MKNLKSKSIAFLLAFLAFFTGLANAAVPEEVETAIATAGTDAAAVASAVFVVLVGIFAVKLMRRAL